MNSQPLVEISILVALSRVCDMVPGCGMCVRFVDLHDQLLGRSLSVATVTSTRQMQYRDSDTVNYLLFADKHKTRG
jgi:hypothetical protein